MTLPAVPGTRVYVDRPGSARGRRGRVIFTCHLFADTREALLEFAVQRLGLRPEWLQGQELGRTLHFDLTAGKRAEAIRRGAVEVSTPEAVRVWRSRNRQMAERSGS